jgi:hypothetical protein
LLELALEQVEREEQPPPKGRGGAKRGELMVDTAIVPRRPGYPAEPPPPKTGVVRRTVGWLIIVLFLGGIGTSTFFGGKLVYDEATRPPPPPPTAEEQAHAERALRAAVVRDCYAAYGRMCRDETEALYAALVLREARRLIVGSR